MDDGVHASEVFAQGPTGEFYLTPLDVYRFSHRGDREAKDSVNGLVPFQGLGHT